jgi:hypothetical protein
MRQLMRSGSERSDPGMRYRSTRYKQPFDPLNPEARLARALVDLDPGYALAQEFGCHLGALHSADAASEKLGRHYRLARRSPEDV